MKWDLCTLGYHSAFNEQETVYFFSDTGCCMAKITEAACKYSGEKLQ